ncbi:O-antigen ligase [Sulfuriferula sp. AH1]|uniref:O-antigen ligase family protein n=1 Tax=Sulfuriferula sp. AH1 TaxID=1985873 RepID=UPI0012F78F11|nr:O-antigen ligase family protein [Sulfuriferula sp. AH1]
MPQQLTARSEFAAFIQNYGWWLIALFIFAMPFGKGFEVPLAFMAIGGMVLLAKEGTSQIKTDNMRWALILFACIWLPILISLPDAVALEPTASTALAFLRFPFAIIFAIYALSNPEHRPKLFTAIFGMFTIVIADGLLQAMTGRNILGSPMIADRLSGLFYPKLTMGLWIAPFGAIYFEKVRQLAKTSRFGWAYWLLLAPYTIVVLLSGSRASWGIYAVSMAGFALYLYLINPQRAVKKYIAIALLLFIPMAVMLDHYPPFKEKVAATAGLFSGNYDKINAATSIRLPIWTVALKMSKDHWINGVGPRGFRYAYPPYAEKDDVFLKMNPNMGPNHPHQIFLEVLVETGIIGVIGYLLFLGLLIRLIWQAIQAHNHYAPPLGIAVFAAIMPINAGIGFYASVLSAMSWWMLAIFFAVLMIDKSKPATD